MKNKAVVVACLWHVGIALAYGVMYGALYLERLATGQTHRFQDLWPQVLVCGTSVVVAAALLSSYLAKDVIRHLNDLKGGPPAP